jgi:hypothetical protein
MRGTEVIVPVEFGRAPELLTVAESICVADPPARRPVLLASWASTPMRSWALQATMLTRSRGCGCGKIVGGTGIIKLMFVISNGGRHIHGGVSELIPPFSTTAVPTQTSFDAWKVDSEQDD